MPETPPPMTRADLVTGTVLQALHQALEHERRATEKKGAGRQTFAHQPRQLFPVQMPRFALPVLRGFTQDMRHPQLGSGPYLHPGQFLPEDDVAVGAVGVEQQDAPVRLGIPQMAQVAHQRRDADAPGDQDQVAGFGIKDVREASERRLDGGRIPGSGPADAGGKITRLLDGRGMEAGFGGTGGYGEMVFLHRQPPAPEQGDELELPRQKIEAPLARRRGEFNGPNLGALPV